MRRILLVLLLLSGATAVVEGLVPCDVAEVSPDCYVALRPGPTRDALELVDIASEDVSESAGQLVLTTVSVDSSLTLTELWDLRGDPASQRADRSLYFPDDVDEQTTREQFATQMAESTQAAAVAALRQLGFELEATGVDIRGVVPDGPAEGVLTAGEVLVAIGGTPVTDVDSVLTALDGQAPGDEVTLTVEVTGEAEDGEAEDGGAEEVRTEQRTLTLGENPDDASRAFLGLLLQTRIDVPVDVDIDAGRIGGPSAGLMFALSIVDKLTDEDLTGGLVVAGTGTIGLDGAVGAIGGIQQKVPGALLRGEDPPADVFLVPRGNVEQARTAAVPEPITLVPVDTLEDAVQALAALRAGDTPDGAFDLTPPA